VKYTSALPIPTFDPRQAFGRPGQVYDHETGKWSQKPVAVQAQEPVKPPHFDGETYDPPKDQKRLTRQLERVYEVVKGGEWHTLAGISDITGDPEGSIGARLRDLRKEKFGSYDIRRKRKGNTFSYTCKGKQAESNGQTRLF
jgi:hypothetical protein